MFSKFITPTETPVSYTVSYSKNTISWSPKFKEWLPLLLGGPDFNKKWQGIRIHAGNTSCDTEGCILLGENREPGKVLDSRRYVNLLKRRLAQRPEGEGIHLTIE